MLWLLVSACVPSSFDKLTHEGAQDAGADASPPLRSELDASRNDGSTLDGATLDAASRPDAAGGDDEPGSDAGASCPVSATQTLTVSKPVVELARLAKSPVFTTRVLGPVVRWGVTDHVWLFSNAQRVQSVPAPAATPSSHPYVAFDGSQQPWKSAVTAPWTLKTSTTEAQLPPTVLPLLAGESSATTLTPSSLLRNGAETRTQLYAVEYDASFAPTKVWLASVEDGSAQARRPSQALFSAPPLFALAARADGEYVSMYACDVPAGAVPSRCVAGRVPAAKIDQASAYQVRSLDGTGQWVWSNDLKSGTPVLENVYGTDLSVSYNNYLRRFIAVYGEPLSNDVVLRTSIQPWGPWSEPVRVALPVPAALANSGFREQASLAQNCERRIVISYFAPTSGSGFLATSGDVVLAAVDLD